MDSYSYPNDDQLNFNLYLNCHTVKFDANLHLSYDEVCTYLCFRYDEVGTYLCLSYDEVGTYS